MYESINEQIDVLANFTKSGISPICFTWRNEDHSISSINFVHKAKEGSENLICFAVTSGSDTYKLVFNTKTVAWHLEEVYTLDNLKNFMSLNDKTTKYKTKSKNK